MVVAISTLGIAFISLIQAADTSEKATKELKLMKIIVDSLSENN